MKKLLCSRVDLQISKRFRPISRALAVRFFVLLLCRHGVEWDCDIIADVNNGLDECFVPIRGEIYACNVRLDSRLILSYFLNYSIFYVIKKGSEVLPVHCGDHSHLGLFLGYVPAIAHGSCRVSNHGTSLRLSDLHKARATILNPFSSDGKWH